MSVSGNHRALLFACFCGLGSPASAAEVKPLESCPEVNRLWMGMEEGVVRPAAYEQIRADSDGYVSIATKDGQMLAKGDPWGTLDPEQLEIERRTFQLEENKQKQQLEKGREDARDAQLQMNLELHEAEGKREELAAVAQGDELPVVLKNRAADAVAKLDERIGALREKLEPANLERELRLLDEDCALQIARKRKQLEILEKRSNLVAGFGGQIRIGDRLKEKLATIKPGEPLWVKTGELLGTLVDDRHYEISVSAAGPLFSEMPKEQLLVYLQDAQTGKLIPGDYSRTDETDNGREISRNFIFIIREEGVEGARQAQGTRNLVHVYRKFTQPHRLVYKKDIAFLAPDVLETSGWDGLVRHLWPGSKVIQVGPQTIAVAPKDAN